jgi:type IV pilus assembly protein PilC
MGQVSANKNKKKSLLSMRLQRISMRDKIVFTQNLQIMLRTGLSLARALKTLSQQVRNKRFAEVITGLHSHIEQGTTMAESLKLYPKVFPELYVSMVASGELAGNLDDVLEYLYKQLKKDHELVSKIRGALIYPTLVIVAMVGIGAVMMIFVIPRLIGIFEEFNTTLPLPTRILIGLSSFITSQGWWLAIVLALLFFGLVRWYKTQSGKKFVHQIFLKTPILSPIIQKINLARFARTLSSLIKTDIHVVKALHITSMTVGNVLYRLALQEVAEDVQKGVNISQSLLKFTRLFPAMVVQMITVGEESGEVDDVLAETAGFYEDDIDAVMRNLPQIIEPVLIVVLGVAVGGMAVAIIMPMYSLTQTF